MYRPSVQHLFDIERSRVPLPANLTMRLQRLEKPEPWPYELAEALRVPESAMRLYPNLPPLYEQLGEFLNVPADHLVLGSGIEDFLRSLFWLCCEPGDKAAVTWPTCAMFDVLADMFRVDLVRLKHGPREFPTMDEFISKLPADLKLLFLPNPGQPVELCYSIKDLEKLAFWCECKGTLLAIDEAYWGYGAPTAIGLTHAWPNVIVLRTFSKLFGSAGIRMGCAIGKPSTIKPLEAMRLSTEVTGPSVHAASVMLKHYDSHVHPWAMRVIQGRNWLRDTLRKEGYWTRGQYANHVLVDFNGQEPMMQMADHLNSVGVYVKARFPKPLDTCLLITCGSMEYMQEFHRVWNFMGDSVAASNRVKEWAHL